MSKSHQYKLYNIPDQIEIHSALKMKSKADSSYCPATAQCHDTKVKNAGSQLLFGHSIIVVGTQLYTQKIEISLEYIIKKY